MTKRSSGDDGGQFFAYLKAFLSDPSVAAVTPSSKSLVERTVKAMSLGKAKVIVEYGPARGVLTRRILEAMRPDAKLIAVEFNRKFFEDFSANVRDPRLIAIRGDVREIDSLLAAHGVLKVDRVVSGVPLSFFSSSERRDLLAKTHALLTPAGRFVVTYQFAIHLVPLLKDYFRKVDVEFEIRNIPPCFVFTAIK